MMESMLKLLNMSFGAGICVLLVLLIRGIIGSHLPKVYSYLLWFLVLFRMVFPLSLPSPASLFPVNPEPIQQEILYSPVPQIDTGIVWLNQPVNHILEENFRAEEERGYSMNPIQEALAVWIVIWMAGFFGIWMVQGWKFFLLSRHLKTACRWNLGSVADKNQIFISDQISGAFIIGIFRPKIYLPALADQKEQKFILAHELMHIRRRDYLVKAVWFAALTIYWFQPLLWLGFFVMCQDMEVSCDLAAVRTFSVEERKEYSQTLLHFAENQSRIWTIMAFGEHPVKSRIKHILTMKKPGKWAVCTGIFILFLAEIGLLTNPVQKEKTKNLYEEAKEESEQNTDSSTIIIGGADGPTSIFLAGKQTNTLEVSEKDWENLSKSTVTVKRNYADKEQEDEAIPENTIYLDAASEDLVVFHTMETGLFIFQKEGDDWKWVEYYPKEEMNNIEELLKKFQEFSAENQRRITIEDRYILQNPYLYSQEGSHPWEYDITKWEDGRIALLGGFNNRLIDIFYGWYTPGEPVFHQVYLFDKTGKEWIQEGIREVWYSDQEGKWIMYSEDHEEK